VKESIGNPVGVYRTTLRRAVLRLPILIALVEALAFVLTKPRVDSSDMDVFRLATGALLVWAAACCLVFACGWLHTTLIWKVTLFEGGVRGPTSGFRSRTLAWGEISSAERMPFHFQSINPLHAALQLRARQGPGVLLYEPLVGMQEFKEQVRRLAGEDHPFTRLFDDR
jgi:predicted membrane protein